MVYAFRCPVEELSSTKQGSVIMLSDQSRSGGRYRSGRLWSVRFIPLLPVGHAGAFFDRWIDPNVRPFNGRQLPGPLVLQESGVVGVF